MKKIFLFLNLLIFITIFTKTINTYAMPYYDNKIPMLVIFDEDSNKETYSHSLIFRHKNFIQSHRHNWKTQIINATCTIDGSSKEICICGKSKNENIIKAVGHNLTKVINKEATIEEEGIWEEICENCKEIINKGTIEKISPTPTPIITKENYTYENLDKTMYAKETVNIRTLPTVDGEKIGVLNYCADIKVTGKCIETGWYRVIFNNEEAFISNNYLTETKPIKETETKSELTGEKIIYLTFDDGPSKYTTELLEVLAKYNIKATFFVVSYKEYTHLIKDIYAQGHTIGLHTASHHYAKIYKSEEAFYKDLYKVQDVVYEQIGIRPTIMRFPGGSSNKVSISACEGIMTKLTQSVIENGFQYFDWNIDSNDANGGSTTKDDVVNQVIKSLKKKKTSVVLQHDTLKYSVDAVEEIIVWALENGYTFKTLNMDSPGMHHRVNN